MGIAVGQSLPRSVRRWSVVLAGGEGRRMADWIENRNGEHRPKQYCVFTGSRTMLQHTLARAVQVTPAPNTVTVIGRGHRRFLMEQAIREIPGLVIEQPEDRGTAAGVLLSTVWVRMHDPEATVLILPSDHFIQPDDGFRRHALRACSLAERLPDRFVLLAAIAERPETDYGWILPERDKPVTGVDSLGGHVVWPVADFREKPGPAEAAELFRAGGLWSTLVVAVKLSTLYDAARSVLPSLMDRFDFLYRVQRSVGRGRTDPLRAEDVLRDIYLDMQPADFSRDLLAKVASTSLVQPMHDVAWSDWGRPQRVMESVHRLESRVSHERQTGMHVA